MDTAELGKVYIAIPNRHVVYVCMYVYTIICYNELGILAASSFTFIITVFRYQ